MGQPANDSPESSRTPSTLADQYCAGSSFVRRLLESDTTPVALAAGEILFRQGDPGDSMYLLLQGRLSVQLTHQDGTQTQLAELDPGSPVGEMALLTGQPRSASVLALTESELIRCSRDSYERLARKYPDELTEFTRTITHRVREIQLAAVLARFFGIQDTQLMSWLLRELTWIDFDLGDVLFREGDRQETMYIIVSGRLRITTASPDGTQHVVGEVSPGELVGELGLLSGEPRVATAVAIRETHLVEITLPVFEQLAERHPEAVIRLAKLVIKRQQRTLQVSPSQPIRALNLTLVPASPDVPLIKLADMLADHLGTHGSVLTLDSKRLDNALGKSGASQAAPDHPLGLVTSAWLNEQENRYRYLLYVADPDWSPWTERCVCQADRVLILADAGANWQLGPVEQVISHRKISVRQELILLHPEDTRQPSGTAHWLAKRDLHAHHHVRWGDQSHMMRLARRLAGKALGLVLSGGAARGFAHVGVLRALEERGLEIDLIGGTSMGSLVGGVYATDRDLAACIKLAERFANPKQLFDYTLPLTSLMASKKVTQVIREVLGDHLIEDLWRPFFCISSNLTRAKAMIHDQGYLWRAVRASIAIPGIFSPILDGEDVLVDGGAMNNFPVDIMVERCDGGPVIGSNTCPPMERGHSTYFFGPSINGWQVLWSRINPFTPAMPVPTLLGSLSRAQEIRGVINMQHMESLADLAIRPDIGAYNIMDFAAYEPIIEIGYETAKEQLVNWPGTLR